MACLLHIETDEKIIKQMKSACKKRKITYDVAHTGDAGKKAIKRNVYDYVVTELLLPKVDGFEILALLQKKQSQTKVIVMTHLAHEDDQILCKHLGAHDMCIKPLHDVATVMKKIDEYIAKA